MRTTTLITLLATLVTFLSCLPVVELAIVTVDVGAARKGHEAE
jgi:hypothetical protein